MLSLRQGVRINLLAYPEHAEGNFSVRVSDVRRVQNGPSADLVLSVRLAREGEDQSKASIPLRFEIDGARSEVMVEMDKTPYDLKDYRIPLESKQPRSWGKVTIPADLNPADNDFYFAFEKPVPRHAVIVVEDAQVARSLQLAAAITPDPGIACTAEVRSRRTGRKRRVGESRALTLAGSASRGRGGPPRAGVPQTRRLRNLSSAESAR